MKYIPVQSIRCRRAFTFIELMVTVTIIAIVSMAVLPSLRNNDRARVMAASQLLVNDIQNAQVMTIAVPDDPVIVRIDPENNRYWLAYADDPETPITHEVSGESYLVTMGIGRAGIATGVMLSIVECPLNTIAFDATGGLVDFTVAPILRLSLGDEEIEIIVAPTTGSVFEREGGAAEEDPVEEPLEEPLAGGGELPVEDPPGEGEGGGGLLGGLLGGLGL